MGCGPSRHIHDEPNEPHPFSAPVAPSVPMGEINLADPVVTPIVTPRGTIHDNKPQRPQPTRHASAPSETTLGRNALIRNDGSGSLSTTRPASAHIPKGIHTPAGRSNTQPSSLQDDDPDLVALREQCPRFRILIIGRAGAGKTTILQRICNTNKPPIVHDRNGNVVDLSKLNPTDDRGEHNINEELFFSGNNAFIFHDSPGFSAGSADEIDAVRDFIAQRAAAPNLQDQLHAIWDCLPTDNDRPWSDAELSFFEEGTGQVPVIAIFTKYDGMILREYNRLRFEEGLSRKEARERAPEYADKLFGEYLEHLKSYTHPPARWLRVQDMQKEENSDKNVANISKETKEVLDFKRLNLLYMSVLLNICTEDALRQHIIPALEQSELSSVSQDEMTRVANGALLSYDHLPAERRGRNGSQDSSIASPVQQIVQVEKSTVVALAGQGRPTLQILKFAIAILIIAEDSFWCKEGRSTEQAFRFAQDQYQTSNRHSAVTKEVEEHFSKVNLQEFSEKTKEKLAVIQGIVKKFRAPISQKFLP